MSRTLDIRSMLLPVYLVVGMLLAASGGCSVAEDSSSDPGPTVTGQIGEEGRACYANDTCNAGLLCSDGTCVACEDGTAGCPCFGNGSCFSSLVCLNGRCVETTGCDAQPDCSSLECGPDPVCGISCGSCSGGAECIGGKCKGHDDLIIPEDQADLPATCRSGSWDYKFAPGSTVVMVPVKVWVQDKNGYPAFTEDQIREDLQFSNTFYAPAGINFYLHDTVSFTNEDELVFDSHFVSLVYFHNLTGVCGKAMKGPVTRPYAKVDVSCAYPNGSTTPHELGHAMGLHHPHGTPNGDADPVEPLSADCYNTKPNEGDYLCDTPPDPSNKYCSDKGCRISCKAPYQDYQPLVDNLMSYYDDDCQSPDTAFSTEQANTMRCIYENFYKANMACPTGNCGQDTCPEICTSYQCGIHSGCNCGSCPAAYECSVDGTCKRKSCDVLCGDRECGTYNECECGSCGVTERCMSNYCQTKPCPDLCADNGKDCGNFSGCACGICNEGIEKCLNNVCVDKSCPERCQDVECGQYLGCDCGTCSGQYSECNNNVCQEPDCASLCLGKECGSPVAGCQCGVCGYGEKCQDGQCVEDCVQLCSGKECGTVAGCTCGSGCGFQEKCQNNLCVPDCTLVCSGKECGSLSGCPCGTCGFQEKCQTNQCVTDCTQVCSGKECGSVSGCPCGTCGFQEQCQTNQCVTDCTQVCSGKECGSVSGCFCGSCDSGEDCANYQCVSTGPLVTSVSPTSATFGNPTTFTVKGSKLTSSSVAWIGGCADLTYNFSGLPNQFKFTCTPKWDGTGYSDGVIKDRTGGTELYSFSVNVTCSNPTVVDVAPLTATLNQTTTFTATGACLPATTVAFIGDCDALSYVSRNDDSVVFKCTPKWTKGLKDGLIKTQAGGTTLFDFTLNVK